MLPDRYRELLTAYVDGELTSRQRRRVAQLLHRSPEARRLLRKLQEDAGSLRQLPRPPLPVDLSGPVLRSIVERRLTPGPRRPTAAPTASAWVAPIASWATAAAVLIVLGVASYLYFAVSLTTAPDAGLAQQQPDRSPPDSPRPSSSAPAQAEDTPGRTKTVPDRPRPVLEHPTATTPDAVVRRPPDEPKKQPEVQPAPPREDASLTSPLEMFHLEKISDTLPVVLARRDLEQDGGRQQLLAELRKDSDFRLELPCRHGTRAFERLDRAARSLNLGLIVEKQAQERIKQKWKTNYVVYLENVTADELTRLLRRMGEEDRTLAGRKPSEVQFDRIVLTRMTPQHHKELSTLLGVDPTATRPGARGPLGTDPRKPLADQTAQQVGNALAGQGGAPRPGAGRPAPRPPENVALVLAYNPVRPSPGSAEIKQFLDNRKPPRPGTLRVLLVLRG